MNQNRPTPDHHPADSATNGSGRSATVSATIDSPVGPLTVVATAHAIVAIEFGPAERPAAARQTDQPATDRTVLDRAITQLGEYFAGERTEFDLPLAPVGTEFQRAAWDALTQIPFGETVTYGEQARAMGDRRKARAVGAANGRNPLPIVVPCHRVIGGNGHLVGFAGGLGVKAWLLDHERTVRAGR